MNALVQEYDPALKEEYGITQRGWQFLCTQTFPHVKNAISIQNALEYCRNANLDIFASTVNIVDQYDSDAGAIIETVWPSFQSLLARANGKFSRSEAEFGPIKEKTFSGTWHEPEGGKWVPKSDNVTLSYPEYVRLTITTFEGERALNHPIYLEWEETYATIWSSPVPTLPWRKRPKAQLEKCAIASALREAFPLLGYCAEEMEGRATSPKLVSQQQNVATEAPDFPADTAERIRKALIVHKNAGSDRASAVARSESRYENIPGYREAINRLANDIFGPEAADV
ncbi:MAG: recombinase RecT [Porticoccaceae bacterium]